MLKINVPTIAGLQIKIRISWVCKRLDVPWLDVHQLYGCKLNNITIGILHISCDAPGNGNKIESF